MKTGYEIVVEHLQYDLPLPEWAIDLNPTGVLKEGTQLLTKDGRRTGNAFIFDVEYLKSPRIETNLYAVMTDIGNKMRLTETEVHELFYVGPYIMDTLESINIRSNFIKD